MRAVDISNVFLRVFQDFLQSATSSYQLVIYTPVKAEITVFE